MQRSNNDFSLHLRAILTGVIAGVSLAIAFVGGFYVNDVLATDSPPSVSTIPPEDAGYPLVDEVQSLIDRVYLREQPSYTQRQYDAIRGLLGGLGDANTFFIEPPVAQSEANTLAGTFGGIGVQTKRNEEGFFVIFPYPDSPAAEVGIQDGAVLVAINGIPVEPSTQLDAVDQMMRGEVIDDNGIEITVQQNGESVTQFIVFQVINVPSVLFRLLDQNRQIGYVQVLRFTSRTPDELRDAIDSLKNNNIQALVVDLRNNSGGLLRESIDVAGEFINGGVVIYEQTNQEERTLNAERGGAWLDEPLVVLVNSGTASASEVVAGAIRDRERGILIGQQTFGKGTVQQIFALSDGSSVHITSAEWFTPDRTPLSGVGLEPTIAMIPDANGRDVELGEAIRYLQGEINSNE